MVYLLNAISVNETGVAWIIIMGIFLIVMVHEYF